MGDDELSESPGYASDTEAIKISGFVMAVWAMRIIELTNERR